MCRKAHISIKKTISSKVQYQLEYLETQLDQRIISLISQIMEYQGLSFYFKIYVYRHFKKKQLPPWFRDVNESEFFHTLIHLRQKLMMRDNHISNVMVIQKAQRLLTALKNSAKPGYPRYGLSHRYQFSVYDQQRTIHIEPCL